MLGIIDRSRLHRKLAHIREQLLYRNSVDGIPVSSIASEPNAFYILQRM